MSWLMIHTISLKMTVIKACNFIKLIIICYCLTTSFILTTFLLISSFVKKGKDTKIMFQFPKSPIVLIFLIFNYVFNFKKKIDSIAFIWKLFTQILDPTFECNTFSNNLMKSNSVEFSFGDQNNYSIKLNHKDVFGNSELLACSKVPTSLYSLSFCIYFFDFFFF